MSDGDISQIYLLVVLGKGRVIPGLGIKQIRTTSFRGNAAPFVPFSISDYMGMILSIMN